MLNRLITSAIVIAVFAGAAGLWLVLDQPVQNLSISGELTKLEQTAIREHLRVTQLRGILSTDLDALVEGLDDLQWVRDISVRRLWPHTVQVALTRERPVAAISVQLGRRAPRR